MIFKAATGVVQSLKIMKIAPDTEAHSVITRTLSINDIKNKDTKEAMKMLYSEFEPLYKVVLSNAKSARNYEQQIHNLKHYVKETLLPKCGNVFA